MLDFCPFNKWEVHIMCWLQKHNDAEVPDISFLLLTTGFPILESPIQPVFIRKRNNLQVNVIIKRIFFKNTKLQLIQSYPDTTMNKPQVKSTITSEKWGFSPLVY